MSFDGFRDFEAAVYYSRLVFENEDLARALMTAGLAAVEQARREEREACAAIADGEATEARMRELYEVLGASRESTLPEVRARLWGAVRLATGWSTPKLAEFFGRDSSTLIAQIGKYYPEAMGTGKKCRRVRAVAAEGVAA